MASAAVNTSEQPTNHSRLDTLTATPVVEGDHPPSSPERILKSGENTDHTTNNHQWNGDPMDWESWPTGRPGPFVSESQIRDAMEALQISEQKRDDMSRTEEKIFHVAEFSSTGRGTSDLSQLVRITIQVEIFVGHVTEPELATWLKVGTESLWLLTTSLSSGTTT